MSIARTMRTLTIMGRSEDDKKIDVAKLLYPAMQAVDIHSLDVDISTCRNGSKENSHVS